MSQAIDVVEPELLPNLPPSDLPAEDGVPLESDWHRGQMNLLIDSVTYRWRARRDFFAGGNMFIYFSMQQVRNRDYRGPDFFVVKDIDGSYARQKWEVWEENGRYPDVIIELMSPTTAQEDLGPKKALYERTFRTRDYFCYDPDTDTLWGWRLGHMAYEPLQPDVHGRLWSTELDAWLGAWDGAYLQRQARWLRLFDTAGQLIPTEAEAAQQAAATERQRAEAEHQRAEAEHQRAEAEHQRAENERQRAETAEAELARLRALLEAHQPEA
ncbi:MAG: Uma2 family endonuclease [Candidatus Tectimicrobiota bacterium]